MANGVRRLLAGKVSLAGEWAPDEIAGVLEPLPAELDVLYGDRRIAASFAAWWPALLERVDGERLPAVLDLLMDCGGRPQVRAEIERRLRGVRKPRRDPLLLFYLAVIRYEEGSDYDSRRFRDVLKRADAATRERLRAAAARLARHTQDPLRHALQTFDFEPLGRGAGAARPRDRRRGWRLFWPRSRSSWKPRVCRASGPDRRDGRLIPAIRRWSNNSGGR